MEFRLTTLDILTQALLFANENAKNRWGITLLKSFIRLNVGKIEVLTIHKDCVHFVVDKNSLPNDILDLVIQEFGQFESESVFKSVKNAFPLNLAYYSLAKYYPKIIESFFSMIKSAAKTSIHNMTANAHSPAVIEYCSIILDKHLEQPFYYKNINENDLQIMEGYKEGKPNQITTNIYERNPLARKECIESFGWLCSVCGFNFEKIYGTLGKDFIHVHHLNPLAEISEPHLINPINDLRPICPNCHAMIHRYKDKTLTIKELKTIIIKQTK